MEGPHVSYLIVFFIAAAVGAAVYFLSIRDDADSVDDGYVDEVVPASTGTHAFLPISTTHQDWATRLTGLVGLLITVVVGAVALAVSMYLSVSWLAHKIGDVATNGGAPQR